MFDIRQRPWADESRRLKLARICWNLAHSWHQGIIHLPLLVMLLSTSLVRELELIKLERLAVQGGGERVSELIRNHMEINFGWVVFLALLAVMRMNKDSWSQKKKGFQCDEFRKRCFRAEALHWSGFVTHCHYLMAGCDTNWGKCSTFTNVFDGKMVQFDHKIFKLYPSIQMNKKRVYWTTKMASWWPCWKWKVFAFTLLTEF